MTAARAVPASILPGAVEVRVEVRPRWPFRLPRSGGFDGLMRNRRGVQHRLLHLGGEPVLVRVAQPAPDIVLFGAQSRDRDAAQWGIERVRAAFGVDRDLRPFYERFRFDRLIGRAVRREPTLRITGRPDPFEALVWAICEQLIEAELAVEIQRRLTRALGRFCPHSRLYDSPAPAALARETSAVFEACGLSGPRSITLRRAAGEIASGRVDLLAPDREQGWERLRSIPGIGSWTLQKLALTGQGRLDQLPAGDLAYLKLVGRLRTGHPKARATEEEVMEFFEPYGPWAGLAGAYALRVSSP